MIKDKLKNFRSFIKVRPDFYRAFEFLSQKGLTALPDGRHEIEGEKLYASVSRSKGKGVK